MSPTGGPRVAVVGAGIAGLAAAARLRHRLPAAEITVYERSGEPGGKLRTGTLAGQPMEFGAEAFLARDPDGGPSAAMALASRVGLDDEIVHPATGRAAVALGGRLLPVPAGTLVGVPGDLAAVAPLARPAAHDDRDEGRPLLAPGDDIAVGELVRRRLGDEVVDRLVDPMLGGVYAGRADDLSLAATMPALARAARTEHTLTGAVRAARAANPAPPGTPVFATLANGVGRLVSALIDTGGFRLCRDATVRELRPEPDGWRLVIGAASSPRVAYADAVVLAVPARPAARLLAEVHAGAAGLVGRLDYASVALVSLALPAPSALPALPAPSALPALSALSALPAPSALPVLSALSALSGFLVPAGEATLVKAATFVDTKWAHRRRADGLIVLRASLGRHGEEHRLQVADDDLVTLAHQELARLIGTALPAPVDAHVQRWGGALPQYRPGHLDRVAAARTALADAGHTRLALAGAAYDGVGIPACVRSGETAADRLVAALAAGTPGPALSGGSEAALSGGSGAALSGGPGAALSGGPEAASAAGS